MAIQLSITLQDAYGRTTSKSFETNPAVVTDQASAATVLASLVSALDAITDMAITRTSINHVTVTGAAAPTGNVLFSDQMAIVNNLADGTTVTQYVPSVPNTLRAAGSNYNVIDSANAAWGTFFGLFQAGGGLLVSDGELLIAGAYATDVYSGSAHVTKRARW